LFGERKSIELNPSFSLIGDIDFVEIDDIYYNKI
jgi:hypothetical protein